MAETRKQRDLTYEVDKTLIFSIVERDHTDLKNMAGVKQDADAFFLSLSRPHIIFKQTYYFLNTFSIVCLLEQTTKKTLQAVVLVLKSEDGKV